ncbi:MAG: aminotransferase class I/II-fold pyridoxal phosphate-dependent enzyme [Acidobacteriota bacterium]|nr:aminotransferase class I/II-fold pyridoxal phosphate-dependent enzyme [Acidobacteriota bacterium]
MTEVPAGGFRPPPYPYHRLAALAEVAAAAPGGLVDLSVGTPCDPPPPAVVAALASSGTERGYPPSTGSPPLRQAAARYLGRRFGVDVDPGAVAACVGTKELVASAAWYLRLRSPGRDTVLGPRLAYPTYAMGATLAGCRYVGLDVEDGRLDVGSVSDEDAARAVVLWANSPGNPSGEVLDLGALARWGRAAGVPVCSDECYAEFTWSGPPASVLEHGSEGVLSVHSLSKRSNLAGVRVGFYAGDPGLVGYLAAVRTHAGLMVAGPVQAAAVVALDDDDHVAAQRARYERRLEHAVAAFRAAGLEAAMPGGGFYLWVPVPDWARAKAGGDGAGAAWVLTEALARAAGMLVSPGEFYGGAGADHVRVALVVPDDRLGPALDRLVSSADALASAAVARTPPGGAGSGL